MKTRIKTNTAHINNNTKKIKNWSEYNKSLKNRGNLSIFISEALVKDGSLIVPAKTGRPGRPMEYANELIEFVLTIRELFHMPLRQATGFVEFLFKIMGISGAPDYTTVSKRMGGIKVRYWRKIDHITNNEPGIVMLIDSSGFKVFGEGEWKVRKHGKDKRRTWRETHIALDYDTRDILGFTNTSAHTHDNTQLRSLLKQVVQDNKCKVKTVIGDGAYESKDNYKLVASFHASIIAPPNKNAIYHYDLKDGKLIDIPGYEERNKVIRAIQRIGGLEEWKNSVDYHRRSLVENAFYRWKTIFSDRLKSRKDETQYTEQCLRAKIINKFNELGLPKYELAN